MPRVCSLALTLVLCLAGALAAVEQAPIDLGQDVLPGVVVSASQLGLWRAGETVTLTIAARDESDDAALDRALELRSGAPGLDEDERGPLVQGRTGQGVTIAVDEAIAAHTNVEVTLRDATGNSMTSRFVVVR